MLMHITFNFGYITFTFHLHLNLKKMNDTNDTFSNTVRKKINKKLARLQHVILKETGINCTLQPRKNLVICNTGLVNGLSEELVYEHFSKHGTLESIVLLPGKSCCFIGYRDLTSATVAYDSYNAKLDIAQGNKPIYMLYCDDLPVNSENVKDWNNLPSGLVIIEDFITEDEERTLTNLFTFDATVSSEMKNRQVRHYGYEFRYDINNVDKDKPLPEKIPQQCIRLLQKLNGTNFNQFQPDQLTINHYEPGQGIPDHVDTHSAFEDPIMSLSLLSPVIMEFKKFERNVCVMLPRRSLAIMSGESRYDWTHGITPRKYDVIKTETGFTTLQRKTRISLTFRKILRGDCRCAYKTLCDCHSENGSITENEAVQLEKLHVRDVYDNIAEHFSDTRHKPWPNVVEFIQGFNTGSIIADVGCGNGKYLPQDVNIVKIGCDTSFNLLDICRERNFETFCADCLNLPLKDSIVDGVISIAVIHHLATEERRTSAIKEILRVLKDNGLALIYVWAKDQHRNQEKSSYLKQDRKNRKNKIDSSPGITAAPVTNIQQISVTLPVHVNRTQFKDRDLLVPWKKKGSSENLTFLRYYHVFEENELEHLCLKLIGVEIVRSYYDQGNWCVVIRKKS